ncbi:MAG TPA: glucan biosynthesis protein G [Verrucomicrobiae bacterium]|jgi:glucans biosynthesis protein
MMRILILTLVLWAVRPAFALPRLEAVHVTLDYVAKKAEQRARKPFRSPRADLPDFLTKLTYDDYRQIRFRPDQALWKQEGLPFRVEFFHLGYIYQEPVHLNEFSSTHVQPVRFVPDFFDYGTLHLPSDIPANTGYAGFRINLQWSNFLNGASALEDPNRWDEVGSFQGASYFRLLGQGQVYGLSARGLALDCGEPDRPEEFPIFTDWWLGKPQPEERDLLLYAILDSVSCAGAYEFIITPGATTAARVESVIYFRTPEDILAADPKRKKLAAMGLAPLTSMYWYGQNSERKFDDYRPEVHDSDGLLMQLDSGEHVWRPLVNGSAMRHQTYPASNIRGFGLMQRNRDFNAYQDMFHDYEKAPSVWVAPKDNWGEGRVHVVELSTQYEGLDNVVAYWDPAVKPAPLQPFRFGYTLYWTRETDIAQSSNLVVSTMVGLYPRDQRQRQFVIDFDLPVLKGDSQEPKAAAHCGTNATISLVQVFRNATDKTWRVFVDMLPNAGNHDPVDLSCTLKRSDGLPSETWSYRWSPP